MEKSLLEKHGENVIKSLIAISRDLGEKASVLK